MDEHKLESLMRCAIDIARNSKPEDDRHHPLVGAVLADNEGEVVLTSYRGESGKGDHAEYSLIERAKVEGIDLSDKILFVTLEPCSRRSPGKLPCAVRVARSGIKTVYIGALDPNPQIIGRGVNYLIAEGVRVEHFPAQLRHELIDLNTAFIGTHGYLVDPIVSDQDDEINARQRAGILTTTLDLIASSTSALCIFTGDTSWLRDIFVALLEASLNGCTIRMAAQKRLSESDVAHATAIGINVSRSASDRGLRATLSMREDSPKSLVVVEDSPARHAQIFTAPHDDAVLNTFLRAFDSIWDELSVRRGLQPELRVIPFEQIAQALRRGVNFYRTAKFELIEIDISDLCFLSNDVELFKLRRVASTNRIMRLSSKEPPLHVVGTPWGFYPPIIERDGQGRNVVVDGVHRIYQARHESRNRINAIVVSGVEASLPAVPIYPWSPNIIPMKRQRVDRYESYDDELFRPIRHALESGSWNQS